MQKYRKPKNIFADKATLVLRRMLQRPEKKWVVRDFIGSGGVSLGMAQEVLSSMEKQGFVERHKRGPGSFTVLSNQEKLLFEWLKEYQFELNEVYTYYNPDKDILKKIKLYLKEGQYAFTLHTGANLMTSFVNTEEVFMYMNLKEWGKDILQIRQKLELKELVKGGNIHIVRPLYRKSAFFNKQKIKGYSVVSNLQLYLDLYNFQPRGKEHAECLKELLQEKGRRLD